MTRKQMIEGLEFFLNKFEDDELEQIEIIEGAIADMKKMEKIMNVYKKSNVKFMYMAEMTSQFEEQIIRILEDN